MVLHELGGQSKHFVVASLFEKLTLAELATCSLTSMDVLYRVFRRDNRAARLTLSPRTPYFNRFGAPKLPTKTSPQWSPMLISNCCPSRERNNITTTVTSPDWITEHTKSSGTRTSGKSTPPSKCFAFRGADAKLRNAFTMASPYLAKPVVERRKKVNDGWKPTTKIKSSWQTCETAQRTWSCWGTGAFQIAITYCVMTGAPKQCMCGINIPDWQW